MVKNTVNSNFFLIFNFFILLYRNNQKIEEKEEDGITASLKGKSANTLSSKINKADLNDSVRNFLINTIFNFNF